MGAIASVTKNLNNSTDPDQDMNIDDNIKVAHLT